MKIIRCFTANAVLTLRWREDVEELSGALPSNVLGWIFIWIKLVFMSKNRVETVLLTYGV